MKNLRLSLLVVPFLLAGTAAGQGTSHAKSVRAKAVTLSGQVSPDGQRLIGKKGEPWSVENPDALAEVLGQRVTVKCQIASGGHAVRVLTVKIVTTQTRYAVNLGDSAYRR